MLKRNVVVASLIIIAATACKSSVNKFTAMPSELRCVTTYPDEIMEAHIKSQLSEENVFVLTAYQVPYCGEFRYVRLRRDTLISTSIASFAIRGTVQGLITPSEKERVLGALDSINEKDWTSVAAQGEYVITLSFHHAGNVVVTTCSGEGCSEQVCTLLDIIRDVAQRAGKEYPELSCPLH